jgi:hypothetical protein
MKIDIGGEYLFKKGGEVFEFKVSRMFASDGKQYITDDLEFGWIELTPEIKLLGRFVRTFEANHSE